MALVGASLALLKWEYSLAGYLVAVVGIAVLMLSTKRYFRVMQLLEQNKFEPNVTSILVLVVVVALAIVTAFVLHFLHSL